MEVSSPHPPSPASEGTPAGSLPPDGGGLSGAPIPSLYGWSPLFWQVRRADRNGRFPYGGRAWQVGPSLRGVDLHVVEVGDTRLILEAQGRTHVAQLAGA